MIIFFVGLILSRAGTHACILTTTTRFHKSYKIQWKKRAYEARKIRKLLFTLFPISFSLPLYTLHILLFIPENTHNKSRKYSSFVENKPQPKVTKTDFSKRISTVYCISILIYILLYHLMFLVDYIWLN